MRKPASEQEVLGGTQRLYKFANGYGASVVRHQLSYGGAAGLWELAVLRYTGDYYTIKYDTPITNDVQGHLTDAAVDALLDLIEALPA